MHHKCVSILIFNDKEKLAMQLRAIDDYSYPDHWDFSAGGHIDENESDLKAAQRETLEELGITGDMKFTSKEYYEYPEWNSPGIRTVEATIYKMKYNGPFKINSEEVQKVEFFSLEKIQKMIDSGERFHPEFLITWQRGIVSKMEKITY